MGIFHHHFLASKSRMTFSLGARSRCSSPHALHYRDQALDRYNSEVECYEDTKESLEESFERGKVLGCWIQISHRPQDLLTPSCERMIVDL